MTFPDSWPNGCPPRDSEAADGVVFRLIRSLTPAPEHFLSFAELGKMLRKPPDCPCKPYGLSVFRDRDDAEQMYRTFPKLGKFIARGALGMADGMTKLTTGQQPSHTTWWPAVECDRVKPFADVEEIV